MLVEGSQDRRDENQRGIVIGMYIIRARRKFFSPKNDRLDVHHREEEEKKIEGRGESKACIQLDTILRK